MKMKCEWFMVLLFTILLVSACSEKPAKETSEGDSTEQNENLEGRFDGDEENKVEKEKVEFESPGAGAPDDQGELDVWFEGDVSLDGQKLTVKGLTNLLPESKLYFLMDGIEAQLIGGNMIAFVEDNGEFLYETTLPESFDGLFTLEVKFEPAIQNDAIKEHYGESGENLQGEFIRVYADTQSEVDYKKAAVQIEMAQQDGQKEREIEPPVWEVPTDYGETEIWMEPTITKDDRYVYIDAKSNLLEGTQMKSRASIPGYITSGFIGTTYVNPDGSFRLIFKNPESDKRIKDLQDYEIILEPQIENSMSARVAATYGKNGEHFTGKLVEQDGDKKVIRFHMKVKGS
ncbi:hypothetical protein MHZ95_06610 [Sporosarcina sp. ACRSM]|uniref:hypothetical protein n=1 Tax=Sporosarcina sp. ACRSM TaxID=2918216 RepID=UPI001EF489FB|nr:hypothetical protein [Sporosarcina sp. ACRSM]MCG7334943.1 hypothetical protein [Sporosarcina sp. ACRSM]